VCTAVTPAFFITPTFFAVMHVHFHIIPKFEDGSGLGVVWNAGGLEDGEGLAERIRNAM